MTPCFFTGITDIDVTRRIEKKISKIYKVSTFELLKLDDIPSGYHDANAGIYSFYEIKDEKNKIMGHVAYGMTHVCYFGGCTSLTDQSKNIQREEVQYIIYFDAKQFIKYIEIIDFESNYGYEIAAKWWLKQFNAQRPGSFKLNDNIDGISGATVSCEQFIMTVNDLVRQSQ
jgi:hypothetical protein